MLVDPDYTSPDHEVDLFNAQAAASCRELNEPMVIAIFEELRQQWLVLVSGLSLEAFQNHQIADRLHIEIIGPFAEHRPEQLTLFKE